MKIWLDKTLTPPIPKFINPVYKLYTATFKELNFESNENFVKIARCILFFNAFLIGNDLITGYGEPCGRYAEVVDEASIAKYEIDIKNLMIM